MRITNRNQILSQTRNMNKTLGNLTNSNNMMASQRKLNKAYDNVADATRAMRVRKNLRDKDFYMRNIDDTRGRINSAEDSMQTAVSILRNVTDGVEQALNGTYQKEDREKIAAEIEKLQGEVLGLMNAKFSDDFLFGAAGGPVKGEAPFSVKDVQIPQMETVDYHMQDADGNLLFTVKTGTNVYVDGVKLADGATVAAGTQAFSDAAGTIPLSVDNTNFDEKLNSVEQQKMLNGVPQWSTRNTLSYHGMPVDEMSLNKTTGKVEWYAFDPITGAVATDPMTGEAKKEMPYNGTNYVDVGLGHDFIQTADGLQINPESVMPYTYSGVEMFGLGKTNGISNNIYSAMGEMVTALRANDLDTLGDQFDHISDMRGTLLVGLTDIGTRSNFLEDMDNIHTNDKLAYQEKQRDLEAVDLAEEAMYNKNHEMAWMVTLQLGSKVLPSSLFDFIK